jgi:hypothetical protein
VCANGGRYTVSIADVDPQDPTAMPTHPQHVIMEDKMEQQY